jgi:hypothetical protein
VRNFAPSSTTLNWVEKKLTSPPGGPRVGVTVASAVVAVAVSVTSGTVVGVGSGGCVGSGGVSVAAGAQAVKTKAAMTSVVIKILSFFMIFFSFFLG